MLLVPDTFISYVTFFKLNTTEFIGQRVSFESDGIFGTRYPVDSAIGRIRRQSVPLATEENVANPIICLGPSDALIFDLNLADPRENTSYPKYARNCFCCARQMAPNW